MDVNLLYFTLHGSDPSALTTWGAILIEDGEMESFVGSGNTELEALVEGLTTCLERFPTSLPIVIRSRHRQVLQLGKRWLTTWKENGWEDEACTSLIASLMDAVEIRKIEWFNPPYAEPLDKTALEYAIDEWEYQDQHRPLPELDITDSPTSAPEKNDLEEVEEVEIEDIEEIELEDAPLEDSSSPNAPDAIEPSQTEPTPDSDAPLEPDRTDTEINTEKADKKHNKAQNETIQENNSEESDKEKHDKEESDIESDSPSNQVPIKKIDTSTRENDQNNHPAPNTSEPTSLPTSINEIGTNTNSLSVDVPTAKPYAHNTIEQTSSLSSESTPIAEDHSDSDPIHHSNPDNPIRFPYIDDEGWKQFYTLFDPPYTDTVEVPTRIVAYVSASHNLDLAAWSFALIDRPSTFALIKNVGHRHSTYHRALLQGCIAVMQSLKHPEHSIEFRIDNSELVSLLEKLIEDPFAECFEPWDEESAFVSQLSFYLEQRPVTVKHISKTKDRALSIVRHLSAQGLENLNYGASSEHTIRKTRFPLQELPD